MARAGTLTVKLVGDSGPLEKTLKGVGGKLGTFVKGVGIAGAAAVGMVAVKGIEAAREATKINRLTEQVLKTTGGAANVSMAEIEKLNSRLQATTGVSDDLINEGQNLLLTFTNIRNEVGKGNDIFDQATEASLNMSVALGTDMKSSSIQLGKALNDPIKGITALTRSGVSFTEQQKEQIKTLAESGDVLGAQKIILGELETQFGGAAEAAADPMQKLRATVDDVVETFGMALLPVINTVATWLAERLPGAIAAVMDWFTRMRDIIVNVWQDPDITADGFIGFIEAVVVTLRGLYDWWQENSPAIIAAAQTLWDGLSAVFGAVMDIVRKVVGWFQTSSKDISGSTSELSAFLATTWASISAIIKSAVDAIMAIFRFFSDVAIDLWQRFGKHILDFLAGTWDRIKQVIGGVLKAIQGVFEVFAGLFTGDWSRVWAGIKMIFSGVWDAIKGILAQAFEALKTVLGLGVAALSAMWSAAWDRIKQAFSRWWSDLKSEVSTGIEAVARFFRELPSKLLSALGNLGSLLVNAGRSIMDGLWRGLKAKWQSVKDWVGGLGDQIKSLKGPISVDKRLLIPEGEAIMKSLGVGLDRAWGSVASKLSGITDQIPRQVDISAHGSPRGSGAATGAAASVHLTVNGFVGNERQLIDMIRRELTQTARRNGSALGGLA